MRPNEKFSGGGHARHVCRECAKLGAKELAYRQALRNLENCISSHGVIPRRRRKAFEQFLNHEDPRIREYAKEILEDVTNGRFFSPTENEQDEPLSEQYFQELECSEFVTESDTDVEEPEDSEWDMDVPF